MQLKQESGPEHPRKKFHMINKFNRATLGAAKLLRLCSHLKVDARTKLETDVRFFKFVAFCLWSHEFFSQAYHEWMRGVFYFNKEAWKEALECFSHAKLVDYTNAKEKFLPAITNFLGLCMSQLRKPWTKTAKRFIVSALTRLFHRSGSVVIILETSLLWKILLKCD